MRHQILIDNHCFAPEIQRSWKIPTFSIDHRILFDGTCLFEDQIHRFHIENTHQIKSETIHIIDLHQCFNRMNQISSSHRCIGSKIIATIASIGKVTVIGITEIIIWKNPVERRRIHIIHMVIDYIKIDSDVMGMEFGHKTSELNHSCIWIFRIRRIAAIQGNILRRIITPVVIPGRMIFIHCCKIKDRHQLYMCNAE